MQIAFSHGARIEMHREWNKVWHATYQGPHNNP